MRVAEYINALPDIYRKDEGSNNYKLLSLEQSLVADLRDDIQAVGDMLDINKATGATLDLYGEIYNYPRGDLGDDQYRQLIMLNIARFRSVSDHGSIINSLVAALGIPASEFELVDVEPSGNVEMRNMPYDTLQAAGIRPERLWTALKPLLAAGVNLRSIGVVHALDDNPLYVSSATTLRECHSLEVVAAQYEQVETEQLIASAITHHEHYNIMEVD